MNKYFEEWNGKKFPVRELMFAVCEGMETTIKVADYELWAAIERDYNDGNKDAIALDNDIYFYCDFGFIASDPTDEEIRIFLLNEGC